MTQSSAAQQDSEQATDRNAIPSPHPSDSEAELTELRRRGRMRGMLFVPIAIVALAGAFASMVPASGQADGEAAPIYGVKIPPGYRDWRLISVARVGSPLSFVYTRYAP